MDKVDVAVIGAGPAGSIAAYHLASQGVNVALIEKERFPRDKTCGDGVTGEGLNILLRLGLADWMAGFQDFDILRLSAPDGRIVDIKVRVPAGECYGRTIPRRLLDEQLARAALKTGVRLLERQRVTRVSVQPDGVQIQMGSRELQAQLLVLAEGSHGALARQLQLWDGTSEMIAMRQYRIGSSSPARRLEIHFQGSIMPGYNWLFPLGDGRVNVGSFTYTRRTRKGFDLRAELKRFIGDVKITDGNLRHTEASSKERSHPLHTRFGATRTHADRLLVAGDTAGLVNPLSGEGIAPAMVSGEVAAAHALCALEKGVFHRRQLASYSRALKEHFAADRRAAHWLRMALNRPVLLNRLFARLQEDEELAQLVSYVIIDQASPRKLLQPQYLLRLLGN